MSNYVYIKNNWSKSYVTLLMNCLWPRQLGYRIENTFNGHIKIALFTIINIWGESVTESYQCIISDSPNIQKGQGSK